MLDELVLDRIEVGLLLLDSSLKIIKCNHYLENLAKKTQQEILNQPIDQVFTRFGVPRYKQILLDCLTRGQIRFCSGMMHSVFVTSVNVPQLHQSRQNLQVRRLESNGDFFVLLQITDISDHFQRVFHLKHLIKDLGADYEQAKATGESMRKQAYYDHLTGVYNRNFFMHQLRYEIKQTERNQRQVAVLFLDLDGFKSVNDSFGHSSGDLLLQQTAARLRECVRGTDIISRFGGDEFALILTNIEMKENVIKVAEKIRKSLFVPYDLAGIQVSVSASIGCSMYPYDSVDPQALIDLADRAMYQVKFGGKNSVAFYQC